MMAMLLCPYWLVQGFSIAKQMPGAAYSTSSALIGQGKASPLLDGDPDLHVPHLLPRLTGEVMEHYYYYTGFK